MAGSEISEKVNRISLRTMLSQVFSTVGSSRLSETEPSTQPKCGLIGEIRKH